MGRSLGVMALVLIYETVARRVVFSRIHERRNHLDQAVLA